MKRIIVMLLVLCLLLSLAACAGTPAVEAPVDTDAPASVPAGTGAPYLNADGDDEAPAEGEPGLFPEMGGDLSFYYEGKDAAASMSGGGFGDVAPAASGEAPMDGEPGGDEPITVDDPVPPDEPVYEPGEALKLTAAEWNDNANWPFFTNLVNSEAISFPSFGLDPRNRIKVSLIDADDRPLANETVLLMADDTVLWTARTDKNGVTCVFYEDVFPNRLVCGEFEAPVRVEDIPGDEQTAAVMRRTEEITMRVPATAPAQTGLQVMFIVDTTGSMTDEIAYLQKDFSAIAERVGSEGVQWSASFYRDEDDEYVTRHNAFTSDVAEIQKKINAEYADGGGDIPEAVAEVLTECLTDRADWDEGCVKLAFLIFDAPPHEGKEAELQAAVRAAAEKGIKVIPVVASNAERDTELFGRALAILTNGTYVFLTDDSGVGDSHLEPIVGDYEVELLQDLIVRLILAEKPVSF